MKIVIAMVLINCGNLLGQGLDCTAFIVSNENQFLAKNFDWALSDGLIIFNKKGVIRKSIYDNNLEDGWVSKHSSITFNHWGAGQPLGGINEEGLVIEELSSWPIDYHFYKGNLTLTEFEWIQYQLDNYKSVDEVISYIDSISINKLYFGIHYILSDVSGNSAIIEHIDGKVKVYEKESLPFKVLTNNNYGELLKYIKLRKFESSVELDINSSQDRFLKAIEFQKSFTQNTKTKKIMSVLDSLSVKDTKWSIVYNCNALTINFKISGMETPFTLNLKEMNFSCDMFLDIDQLSLGNAKFQKLSIAANNNYLNRLRKKITSTKEFNQSGILKPIDLLLNR